MQTSEKDWNKIQAQWTVAGVILATALSIAGLCFMWWLDQRHSNASTGDAPVTPVAWWMPALIVAGTVTAGWLHYRAVLKAKQQSPVPSSVGNAEEYYKMYLEQVELVKQLRVQVRQQSTALGMFPDYFGSIEKAGVLHSKAGQAYWLITKLEEIWHLYDRTRTDEGGEVLLYPLGSKALPDEIKKWTHKELWAFRVLYQSHIGALKKIDPNFHSGVTDEGFPCDGQDYLTVKRKITGHAVLLQEKADGILHDVKVAL